MKDDYVKVKVPANLVDDADRIIKKLPYLNVNVKKIGVNVWAVKQAQLGNVIHELETVGFPTTAVGTAPLER